jgi:peptidoglycan L-alanyl-D-glutamate endopeptidase CwlK
MSKALDDLLPEVADQCRALIRVAVGQGIVLVVTHTYRTAGEQAELYAQGRTTPGRIVTHAPPGYSWHEFRRAFDVAIKSFPGDLKPKDFYDGPWGHVGEFGESLGLEWGGRWKRPDRPHFENRGGLTLAEARRTVT